MVVNLLSKNLKKTTVESQILNFFRAFDDFKDEQIQSSIRKLE